MKKRSYHHVTLQFIVALEGDDTEHAMSKDVVEVYGRVAGPTPDTSMRWTKHFRADSFWKVDIGEVAADLLESIKPELCAGDGELAWPDTDEEPVIPPLPVLSEEELVIPAQGFEGGL